MALIMPRCFANVRHLLLALLAIGLVLRMGGGCEAMAATPTPLAAHKTHCADMPTKPDKPVKVDIATCALCGALPDTAATVAGTIAFDQVEHTRTPPTRLAGLSGAPAPPPPKIA